MEIRRLYHQIVDAILNPKLPTLQNTDGDPIEMTTMTYELAVPRRRPSTGCGHSRRCAERCMSTTNATTLRAGSKRRSADMDQSRQPQTQRLGQHDARHVAPRRIASRDRGQLGAARGRIAKEIVKRFGQAATLVETTITDIVKELHERRARGDTGDTYVLNRAGAHA